MARHLSQHLLQALEYDGNAVDDLATAVSEAATNAVQHAWAATSFEVAITVHRSACTVRVVDQGPGFDTATIAVPSPDAEGGRGLALMAALVDRIEVHSSTDGGTVIHMTKYL